MGEMEVALRHPRDPAALKETIVRSLEELQRLSLLLEALLTLARADAGELPLEVVKADATAVTGQVLDAYGPVAAARRIALTPRAGLVGPALVSADPMWLGRAVANLVDNACKFTPAGGSV